MTTQNSPLNSQESLDIKRVITSLINRWWIIAGSLAVILALAAVYSFVIQTPVYESSGSFTLPKANEDNGLGVTREGYLALASSSPVMEGVKNEMGLGLSPAQLRNWFSFQVSPERTLTFQTTADSAETAVLLAETWIKSYQAEVERIVQEQLNELQDQNRQQREELQPQIATAQVDLQRFNLANPPGQLETEVAGLDAKLAKNLARLQDLKFSSIPQGEAKLASFQTAEGQDSGTIRGGGGRPAGGPANGGTPDLLIPVETSPLSTDLTYIEQIQSLTRSQIFNWENDLVSSENRLRELKFSSIPILESRKVSLEEAVAAEPEFLIPPPVALVEESPAISNPVHSHLRQQLSDTRVQLAFERREADELAEKITLLRTQIANLRQDLLVRQEYDKTRATLALNREEAQRLETEIPTLRAAITDLRERILEEGAARQKLEEEAARFQTQYMPAKTEMDRLTGLERQLDSYYALTAIQEPALPQSMVSPQRGRNMGIAVFLGLFIGVAIALVVEYTPGRFNSTA